MLNINSFNLNHIDRKSYTPKIKVNKIKKQNLPSVRSCNKVLAIISGVTKITISNLVIEAQFTRAFIIRVINELIAQKKVLCKEHKSTEGKETFISLRGV